jgi:hypothetical protein
MKKAILSFLILFCFWSVSCNKQVVTKPLSAKELKQKTDSIISARTKELEDMARVDLEYRLKIEVRAKSDSILNARRAKLVKDTAKKVPIPNKAD